MDPSQPGTSGNSRINEATPILQEEICEYDDELYAIGGAVGGSAEADGAICGSTGISGAIIEFAEETEDASGCADEAQSDTDEIVDILFSTWIQFAPKGEHGPESKDDGFFSPRAIRAMCRAWREIRAERDALPEPEEIVEGLIESIVNQVYLRNVNVDERVEALVRGIVTTRIAKGVANGWRLILKTVEREDEERTRRIKERKKRIRERIRRSLQLAEVQRFYAPFARIDYTVPLNCRTFCIFLCQCCSIFIFQIPIHTLLLSWPISIGVMGGLYMTQCPMSYLMPYVMIALGVVGTVALLMRLSFVIYEKISDYEIRSSWPWIVLRLIEFVFLDFLGIQLFYFYSETPSFIPGSPKYCNKTFYSYVHWINYVSIALVSAWLFVYLTKGILLLLPRRVRYRYR